jgi:IclR family pca regulon transcriptional regulator
VHLTVWSTSADAVIARLERPLRQFTAEISTRLGHR